jgi:5'-nucleotidase
MNFLGLQVNTLGNHNFDFGIPHLKARMAEAKYTYVSTNLTNVDKELDFKAPEDSGNRKLRYHMIEVGQASPKPKVAFIGITNRDAPTLIFPGKMGTVTVKEPIAAANDAIKEARRKGAAVVIVLAHLGMTNKDAQGNPTGPLMELAKGLDGADVVFGDHTDVSANTKVGDAVVIESKSRGRTYSKVVVKVVDGKVMSKEASLVDPKETPEMQADPEAETVLKPYRDLLQATQDVKIGTLSNKLERGCTGAGCKPVERIGEIPLGDLVADALLDKYKTDFGAQVVLMNGGGLRQPLPSSFTSTQPNRTNPPFDIVIGDVFSVLPFTNFTVIRKVTGQLLWQIAEHGVADMPNAHGKFPQIAGWRFEWSQTGAAGARVRKVALTTGTACTPGGEAGTDAGSGCAAGQTCNATTSTCEKDIPSNDATEYTIVTNDFLNTGGDNYVMLKEAEPTPPRDELAAVVRDYIKARGTLTYPAHAAYVPMRIIPLP